jgi:hypothetical protein
MGLDFRWRGRNTLVAPRWSYGGFHSFRERLANSAGLGDLNSFAGFGGKRPFPHADEEPIAPLLNHSDCEGSLSPWECKLIAPRLRELVASWPPDDYDRQNAELLASACETCAVTGDPLEFC